MNESWMLFLACVAGLVLGAIFFGGLWWTTCRAVSSQRPVFWFVGSLVLRLGVVLGGLYVVGRGEAGRLLACVFGFFVAQLVVLWLTGPPKAGMKAADDGRSAGEAGHAP